MNMLSSSLVIALKPCQTFDALCANKLKKAIAVNILMFKICLKVQLGKKGSKVATVVKTILLSNAMYIKCLCN